MCHCPTGSDGGTEPQVLDGWTEQEKDVLAIVSILLGLSAGGAFSIVVFGAAIQRWLVDVGVVLHGDDVPIVFPWATDVGIDLPRLLIAISVAVTDGLAVVAAIAASRRREKRFEVESVVTRPSGF
jgi:hypothetical protein